MTPFVVVVILFMVALIIRGGVWLYRNLYRWAPGIGGGGQRIGQVFGWIWGEITAIPNFLAWLVRTGFGLVCLALLVYIGWFVFSALNDVARSAHNALVASESRVDTPAPEPLTPPRQAKVLDHFLAAPLDENDWKQCPSVVTVPFDRNAQEDTIYVLNAVYMSSLNARIINGTTDAGDKNVYLRMAEGDDWQRMYSPGRTWLLQGEQANFVHLSRKHRRLAANDPHRYVDVQVEVTEPKDDRLRIRTEQVIAAGEGAKWGPVWTELNGRPLRWEMQVHFLQVSGQPFARDDFRLSPPDVVVGDTWLKCYTPIIAISSLQAKDGDLVRIRVPADLSDARVFVSFLISGS